MGVIGNDAIMKLQYLLRRIVTGIDYLQEESFNKPTRHLGFRYRFWPKYKVTSTWIGRIYMSCAHAQWV